MNIQKTNIFKKIFDLSNTYEKTLDKKITLRKSEMLEDNNSHYLIYSVLGITHTEGKLIDEYQNIGRFLYKYAGSFLEEAANLCFLEKFPGALKNYKLKNTQGTRPATFEIDCLVGKKAYEIKWRDATTDGDHITKEHTRIKNIYDHGFQPIRIMFFYPNRSQALRIQQTIKTLYSGLNGECYFGDDAWDEIKKITGIDLLQILKIIAFEKVEGKKNDYK